MENSMTKADLVRMLSDYDDDTPVYLRADGMMHSVECTDVDQAMLSDDEPIILLQ
jgi:hypothetical protein